MDIKTRIKITDRFITRVTRYIALAVIFFGCIWGIRTLWTYWRYEQTNDAQVQEYINPVIARVGGYLTEVRYEENEIVAKGDTLLIVDNREYIYAQAETTADIDKQYAQLKELEARQYTLAQTAAAAKSQIQGRESKFKQQELDYNRYHKLYEVDAATAQQLEEKRAQLDIDRSDWKSSVENAQAAQASISDIEAQKRVLEKEISRLKQLQNYKDLTVGYTVITAPYRGRMGKRSIDLGQMITPGQVLTYIVNDETPKWIVANFKETQIRNIRLGDEAEIAVDAYPDTQFKGKVISIAPATGSSFSLLPPDNATGNFVKIVQRIPVRIEITAPSDSEELLKAGMNVNVLISKKQKDAK
ncbi:HlyD family secretion protein [Myroides marinus]|jgi:membrane fusion protein (multidrug efflux system)|uniref:HlyD family secretion protein n=1 Tax=Myroides TaxID=76831 RepID=UPI00074217AB|nr:HlyD family secretion protein [Myroides marinus]KUF38214.1 multidrug transporter [Myroides marinus]MDM1363000.1 HlyD family secretion protein [Myroides marinus]MDM1389943.1 HlyD family secretion protein [Myroides marinus]MDM1533546.1 HlyD family secretion protein [Myroides marinus]MDM1540538.1 HlyD family secretion protein [Myroides marinus]